MYFMTPGHLRRTWVSCRRFVKLCTYVTIRVSLSVRKQTSYLDYTFIIISLLTRDVKYYCDVVLLRYSRDIQVLWNRKGVGLCKMRWATLIPANPVTYFTREHSDIIRLFNNPVCLPSFVTDGERPACLSKWLPCLRSIPPEHICHHEGLGRTSALCGGW